MFAALTIRPLKRREYDRLVDLGYFDNERLELLEGMLILASPPSERHATSVTQLNSVLTPALMRKAEVRVRAPFAASDESEPEPDIAVVPFGDYIDDHPTRALLIVEVADSSLDKDHAKAKLYAVSGVPEYWIVNLNRNVIEVHRSPGATGYSEVSFVGRGQKLQITAFPEIELTADEVLPHR
jgi:Uma2 family endonuclease